MASEPQFMESDLGMPPIPDNWRADLVRPGIPSVLKRYCQGNWPQGDKRVWCGKELEPNEGWCPDCQTRNFGQLLEPQSHKNLRHWLKVVRQLARLSRKEAADRLQVEVAELIDLETYGKPISVRTTQRMLAAYDCTTPQQEEMILEMAERAERELAK